MASRRRNVWSVVFGETILTWPRIFAQQLAVLALVLNGMNAHTGWLRWSALAVAAVTQGWVVYDAGRRLRATRRARRALAHASTQHRAGHAED